MLKCVYSRNRLSRMISTCKYQICAILTVQKNNGNSVGNTLLFNWIFNKNSHGFSHISALVLRCSPHTNVRTEDVNAGILHYKFIVRIRINPNYEKPNITYSQLVSHAFPFAIDKKAIAFWHYSDVKWSSWGLKHPVTRLSVQQWVTANIRDNIETLIIVGGMQWSLVPKKAQ